MTSKDLAIPNTTANEIQENITTHNILVLTLIIHYIKDYAMGFQIPLNSSMTVTDISKFHRLFNMLVLHLIQCPDLTFEELNNLISCGKYQLPQFFIRTFHIEVYRFVNCDLDTILDTLDMFKNLEVKLLYNGLPKVNQVKMINGSSPTGIFLRRILIFFEKMLFLQAEAIINEAKNRCNAVFKNLPVRTI